MAISSEFYKDVSKIEKKVWGMSFRKLKGIAMLIGVGAILALEVFTLPEWGFYIVSVPTALILGLYPILILTNRWRTIKRKIQLHFMYESSEYRTEQIRRYHPSEFKEKSSKNASR